MQRIRERRNDYYAELSEDSQSPLDLKTFQGFSWTPLQPSPPTLPQRKPRASFATACRRRAFSQITIGASRLPLSSRPALAKEIESLGRVLLQFYRAVNLLYRKSVEGKQPEWVARWLDQASRAELIELQRSPAFKNEVPRVIRPDLLLTDRWLSVTELDSVPGGIGLTAWLNQTYVANGRARSLGGADGMLRGFASIFGDATAGPHRRVRRISHVSAGNGLAGEPISMASQVQGS